MINLVRFSITMVNRSCQKVHPNVIAFLTKIGAAANAEKPKGYTWDQHMSSYNIPAPATGAYDNLSVEIQTTSNQFVIVEGTFIMV
jgi:hypothetical protein